MYSRRKILLMGSAAAVAMPIAGCTSTQIAQFQAQWSNFVDQVNGYLAAGCGLIPGFIATANSIESVVAAFYPTGAAAIAAGSAAVQAVASAICSMVPSAPPAALAAKLARATPNVPTVVGNVTINGHVIPIHGYGVNHYGHRLRRR